MNAFLVTWQQSVPEFCGHSGLGRALAASAHALGSGEMVRLFLCSFLQPQKE